MPKHFIKIFLGLITAGFLLIAQTERDIKLSGNYYWGEAEHETEDQAKNAALQDMLFKIQVTVSSEVVTKEEEVGEAYRDEASSVVRAHSNLTLKGVDFLSSTRRGRHRVIAYISKEDYRRSIAALASEIAADVTSIELDQQQQGLAHTLSDYYLAFLKAYQCPQPVEFRTSSGQQYDNVQVYLENKIESYLAELQLAVGKVTVDASIPMVTIPVKVNYRGKPVGGIVARLNIQDGAAMAVVDGSTQFFLYMLPSKMQEDYEVLLSVQLDRKTTPEDLYRLHQSFKISYPKKISIDYREIVRLGFNVYRQASGALLFKPLHTNFSVADIFWDFGDGESSHSQKPLHTYADGGDHIVTLTFNNNPDLRVTKQVSKDGKVTAVAAAPWPEPEPARPVISSPVLKELAACHSYAELGRKLTLYKRKHKLMFGKENTFINPQNCYIFIVNPQTKEIVALLDKGREERQNLLTGEKISDLGRHYRGMVSIYTEIY